MYFRLSSDRRSTTERLETGLRAPTYPYVAYIAPHTTKIHTLITLGIRHRSKALAFWPLKRPPHGFDSHRPLHFSLSGVSLRCPTARPSSSPGSHSVDGNSRSFDRMRRWSPQWRLFSEVSY